MADPAAPVGLDDPGYLRSRVCVMRGKEGSTDLPTLVVLSHSDQSRGKRIFEATFPRERYEAIPLGEWSKRDVLKSFLKYGKAVLITYDINVEREQLKKALALLWVSRGAIYFLDFNGDLMPITFWRVVFCFLPRWVLKVILKPFFFWRIRKDLIDVERLIASRLGKQTANHKLKVAYIKSDQWFGSYAGGSVAHTKHVAREFRNLGVEIFIIAADDALKGVVSKIPVYVCKPKGLMSGYHELSELGYNRKLISHSYTIFERERPSLVYQRYSLDNYAGAYLAKRYGMPLVVEYHGSFLWTQRHWAAPLRYEKVAARVELLNLKAADLIVVVSDPLRVELLDRGIDGSKILVNPNGVDPVQFHPGIDEGKVRRQYQLDGKLVVGFIGTFSPWHGAEVLARTVRPVIKANRSVHYLFIGDGLRMPLVREILKEAEVESYVTFTGLVPQEEGPRYLAACDILVSPHVPNPDGSPFFGSPTKLFEYMAMGRGIVASDLDQIGEVLEHKRTAWLVQPGDVEDLAKGILALVQDRELREALGCAARAVVLEKYTWRHHVQRILSVLNGYKPLTQ